MDLALLSILCCPLTRESLRLATTEEIERINQCVHSGWLNRAKDPLKGPIQECLVGEFSRICYPIRDGLPLLLADESFEIPPL